MELPLNENPAETPAVNSDLGQVIQESKENIQAAEMVPPKRRGRPKKDPNAPATAKRVSSGAGPSLAPATSAVAPPDISKSLIVPLAMLSKVPADSLKVPELMLEKDEAEALAKSLSDLYAVFAPAGQLSPKAAAICNFGLVSGTIFLTKYQIYLEKRPKRKAPEKVEENINPEKPFPTISAEQAFRRNPTQ